MTQAACQLILHYSTARLSWKTIKSLRRSSRRIPTSSSEESDPNDTAIISRHSPPQSPKEDNYDRCQSINTSAARNSNIGDGNDSEDEDEDVSPMEYEILQGWTILAFHSLYVSLNIEYAATFVIPFYFHFKMIILIITFVIPSWAIARGVRSMASSNNRRNDRRSLLESTSSFDEYGLSPAISMWFNYLIVPGVHAVHEFMDHDPKGWAILQFKMSMLAFLNYFVLPGVLMEEEEVNEVRFARGSDLWHEGAEVNDLTSNNRNEREIYDDVQSEDATSSQTPATDSLQREGGLHATTKTTLVRRETPSEKSSRLKSLKENLDNLDVLMEIVDNADSNTNAISLEQIDTNTADDKCNLEEIGQSRYDEGEDFTQFTPPDHQISTPVDNSAISPSQPSTTKRSSFDLLFSSAARNRVATSARKLHRFSKDHQIVGGLISSAKKGKSSENGDGISRYDTLITKLDFSNTEDDFAASDELNPHKQPSLESTSPQRPSSDKPKTRRKRRDRLSLGDHIREVVTGNPNIRIRDHLFDLDLPSPSSPSHAKHPRHFVSSRKGRRVSRGHRNPGGKLLEDFPSPEANDEDVNRKISFVATRRSTRLAKARAAQAYRR